MDKIFRFISRLLTIIGMVVFIFIVVVWYNWPRDMEAPQDPGTPAAPSDQANQDDDAFWQALLEILSAPGQTQDEPQDEPQDDGIIWQELPRDANIPPVTSFNHEEYPNAALLDISELRKTDWFVGQEVTFMIPQTGYVLTTQVEEMKEPYPGIQVVLSYPDETFANHMLVTIGRKNTFVNLFTPEGEFEMVGNEQHGWIVASSELPGPTEDDYIILPPPGISPQSPDTPGDIHR